MVFVGGVEDQRCDFGVDVDGGGGDGDNELVALNRMRANRGTLLWWALEGRKFFVVVDAWPSLDPEEDVQEEDTDEQACGTRHVFPEGGHGR